MVTNAPGENTKAQAEVKKPALDTTQAKLDKLQQDLEWEKNIDKKKAIREEILSIRRSFNRTRQYAEIASLKLAEGKNNLDSISAADLMKIDKEISKDKRGEFLSKSFLYKRTQDADGNTFEEPTDGKNLKEGDILYVDFGGNKSAESKVGIGDFLPVDTKVVKITDLNGKTRIGKRSIQGNKVGYYDEQWYIPVYNGYKVEIPKNLEVETYIKTSNQSIVLSSNTDDENKAKDAFIDVAERYEKFWEGFAPWNMAEKKEFQLKATEMAKKIESKYNIPWQVTYAQATLETGYGKRAPNNNYFWIKGGNGTWMKTKEFVDGKEVEITANFRWYTSMEESFEDYAKLLSTNTRYKDAFQYSNNPELFLNEVIKGGYATDPLYVEKAKKIWDSYDKIKNFNIEAPELIGKTTPDQFISQAGKYLWTMYLWWGNTEYGIDCSHLVSKSLIDLGAATPSFYRVAADLRNMIPNKPLTEIQRGDLIFWHGWERWVSHVAIATGTPSNGAVSILDASGKTSWAWKVSERVVPLTAKLSAWTPPFYS
jgi:flagellum-specific peptidoglycan hydrolase FlgJ